MRKYEDQVQRAREIGIDADHQVKGDGTAFYCLCSCGEPTTWSKKRKQWVDFRPGHDARLVGNLLRKARAGDVDINDAIELLEFATNSDALVNKLRRLWLRV